VIACSAFVASMLGVSYAAVPLYQLFCQVTGYGGTTQRTSSFRTRFWTAQSRSASMPTLPRGLPWDFKPVQREVEVRIGETVLVNYTARIPLTYRPPARRHSMSRRWRPVPISTRSSASALPKPNSSPARQMEMPVVFFVDPAIVEAAETQNIDAITLSYTFFPHETEKPVAAVAEPVQDNNTL
jgi:cytochrome c oxidase assembly protein subunit 11